MSHDLEQKLLSYALAAAGVAALTPHANAEIVFTKANTTLGYGNFNIDLNHDGISDFTLHNYFTGSSSLYIQKLAVAGGADASTKVIGQTHYGRLNAWAAPLSWSIGPNSPKGFVSVKGAPALMAYGLCTFYCNPLGAWGRATDKFLGFQFSINGEVHFGWARLSVKLSNNRIIAKLTGYAYETQPNTAIRAGDRGPITDTRSSNGEGTLSVDTPSLGLLSLGSLSLDAWRPAAPADNAKEYEFLDPVPATRFSED